MSLKFIFGLLSSVIAIVSFLPYIKDIFSKRTKPHIYSWLVWSILQTTGVIAAFVGGAQYGMLGLATGALFCIFIFFLSIRYGTKNITRFDTICLIGALLAIFLWILQKNPLFSVILITLIDFMGFIPTYRKGYIDPRSETASLYLLSAISNLCGLLAIGNYTIITTLYIASLVVTNIVFVLILLTRRNIRPLVSTTPR